MASAPSQPEPEIWTISPEDPVVRDSFLVVEDEDEDEDAYGGMRRPMPPVYHVERSRRTMRRPRCYSVGSDHSSARSGSDTDTGDSDDDSVASEAEMGPIVNIGDTEEIKAMDPKVLKLDDVFDAEERCRVILPYDEKRFAPEDKEEAIVSVEKTEGCVLVLRRVFFRGGLLNKTVLDIRSPLIRNVLRKCVLEERASLETSTSLEWPHELIFRFRDYIKAAAAKEDQLTVSHIDVLMKLVETDFSFYINEINTKFPKGATTFDILREAFLPGEIIVSGTGDAVRGYRVLSAKYIWQTKNGKLRRVRKLNISAEYTSCDGKGFGSVQNSFQIEDFPGVKYFTQLPVYPLRVHHNADAIREKLLARGQKYANLKGQNFRHVKGVVTSLSQSGMGYGVPGGKKTTIDSRVVVDIASCDRLENMPRAIPKPLLQRLSKRKQYPKVASLLPNKLSPNGALPPAQSSRDTLAGEDLLISNDEVEVFSLRDKKFFLAKVDMLQDIAFNTQLFDQLVIDPRTKNLARIMVERHIKGSNFDDFVEGKGKGLVMLLHGPPGVGKTMMAEAIAEHTQRPLYAISSGELGSMALDMERNLARILDIAHTFKAVLLLDEADVFLERRTAQNINRNALVSIFLRLLEYYPGILILTSNRAETFDEAFHSRIHMTFAFSSLDFESRERVWRNFAAQFKEGVALHEDDFKQLAVHQLNGRQIKNSFSAASELASDAGEKVGVRHIQDVLMVLLSSPLLRSKQVPAPPRFTRFN